MTLTRYRPLAGVLLALIFPGVVLVGAAGPDQREAGLAVAPFGWPRVVTVQLLATLPLSLLLTARLGRTSAGAVAVGIVGLLATLATFAAGPFVGVALDQAGADGSARLAVRFVWCLALQLPWCLLGLSFAAQPSRTTPAVAWPMALLAAVAPPVVYTQAMMESWSMQAAEAHDEGRLRRAEVLLTGLADLGSSRPVGGVSLSEMRGQVERALKPVRTAVARPLPPSALPAARIAYAQQLAMLDRLAEAEQLLAPLAGRDVQAALLRATVLQKLERWDESDHDYRAALDLLTVAPEGGRVAEARLEAYQGLAYNARAAGRPADAEAAYRDALERVSSAAAHIHLQMGRHYQQGGRPGLALEHLREAVRLDPTLSNQARTHMNELAVSSPGCLLRGVSPTAGGTSGSGLGVGGLRR